MRIMISSINAIVLLLFFSAGRAQVQSGTEKPPQKAPAAVPAQVHKESAKEPEEVIPPAGPDALFPALVARVNSRAVLGRELEQRVHSELAGIGSPAWKNLKEDYRRDLTTRALAFLIDSELIYQKATESGVKVSDTEVQAEVDKVAKSFASDAEMNTQLAGQGLDRAGLSKELARGLVMTKFIEENIGKKVVISPAEAQQYYSAHPDEFRHPDVVRTSHILILVPQGATADQDKSARQRAESLLQRVKQGEDFAKLAKENSMDGSASQGGDIGFAPKGQLDPAYEEAAFSLPVGGLSNVVVRTQFGYHIIKVTDKKKEGISTLDEIRPQLIDYLKNQKVQAEVGKYVMDLRSKAKVEIFIPVGTAETPKGATTSSPRP